MDLAEAVEFDRGVAYKNTQAVRRGMKVIEVSAKTGVGLGNHLTYLDRRLSDMRKTVSI